MFDFEVGLEFLNGCHFSNLFSQSGIQCTLIQYLNIIKFQFNLIRNSNSFSENVNLNLLKSYQCFSSICMFVVPNHGLSI